MWISDSVNSKYSRTAVLYKSESNKGFRFVFVCLILFFTSHQQSFSLTGMGLPGLDQY